MGLVGCEWEPCGRQHIMGADDASQAMPQAMGASGTVRRAKTARMAYVRRIAERLPHQVVWRPCVADIKRVRDVLQFYPEGESHSADEEEKRNRVVPFHIFTEIEPRKNHEYA